jgi:serine/threonine protein phosphatase PrpC
MKTAESAANTVASPHVRVGLASHVGRVRTRNEDAALALLSSQRGDVSSGEFGLFLIADGMGGQESGQWASNLAARTVAHRLLSQVYLPALQDQDAEADRAPLQEALMDALQSANEMVHGRLPESGTTLTVALLVERQLYVAHVGDSRAYLFVDGRFERLTRDHSLVERLYELGQLSADEAALHPQRNVLYRAIGQGEGLEIDLLRQPLRIGMRLLLCCDGLWGVVPDERMATIIASTPEPQAACDQLVAEALAAGGPDNITALLVEVAS